MNNEIQEKTIKELEKKIDVLKTRVEKLTNKLDTKDYYQTYYNKNKEKILEKARTKVICDVCGSETSQRNLCTHKKSKLCKKRCYEKKLLEEISEKAAKDATNLCLPSHTG